MTCSICGAKTDDDGDCTTECTHTEEAQFDHLLDHSTLNSSAARFIRGQTGSCCNGTGFADYAAVPCPNPACPTKTSDVVTVLNIAFYGVQPDDPRLEGIMDALQDEVMTTGLPRPYVTRDSHRAPPPAQDLPRSP